MYRTIRPGTRLGIALCCALLGCPSYGQTSLSVGVNVTLPSVEIRAESDFYEPLTPHGEWVVVGGHGRCWRPARVEAGWRPYSSGYWQRTDAGWYWVSDEPWGWATYHYGRWDFTEQYGWYWVPQTQWAPAWVSWHSGGGYVGWAPLQPTVRISGGGFVGFNASLISPRAFVFVEQGRFLEPVQPRTVIVTTAIIKQTTVISNTRIVNNTVINEGPATTVIEKASGRKIQAVPVHELRRKQEAAVVAKHGIPAAPGEKPVQPPAGGGPDPGGRKNVAAPAPQPAAKPVPAPREPAAPAPKNREVQGEKQKPAPAAPELKPEPKPEGNPAPANRPPTQPKPDKRPEKQENPGKSPDKKDQRPPQEKSRPGEKGGPNPGDKDPEKKPKQ